MCEEIHSLVTDAQHCLKLNNEDGKWRALQKLYSFIVLEGDNNSSYVRKKKFYPFSNTLLRNLLSSINLTTFKEEWHEVLFDNYFLYTVYEQSFILLVQELERTKNHSLKLDKIIDLLDKFISSVSFRNMLIEQCIPEYMVADNLYGKDIWDSVISCIVSLPERMTNKMKNKTRDIFYHKQYIPVVLSAFLYTLRMVHNRISEEKDCSLGFMSKLLGRLCISGDKEAVINFITIPFLTNCSDKFIWRRICQKLIMNIPVLHLESVVVPLLCQIPWYGYVEWLLGDSILSNHTLQYLLMTKIPLLQYSKKYIILQNTIGYLAQSDKRRNYFYDMFRHLIGVWSDGSSLRKRHQDQNLYLTSAIMICISHIKKIGLPAQYSKDTTRHFLHGVEVHISNSVAETRTLGMLVGENLSAILHPDGPELKFDYEKTELVNQILDFLIIPDKVDITNVTKEKLITPIQFNKHYLKSDNCSSEDGNNAEGNLEVNRKDTSQWLKDNLTSIEETTPDTDSDDDIVPYDLSNDLPVKKYKKPNYLHDCIQGLINQEDCELVESCLQAAESLIRSEPDDLKEVCIELARTLLYLENMFSLVDFANLRFSALVSLAVTCSSLVAEFLSSNFYDRNLNIRQRLDILEILAAASEELSSCKNPLLSKNVKEVVYPSVVYSSASSSMKPMLHSKEDFVKASSIYLISKCKDADDNFTTHESSSCNVLKVQSPTSNKLLGKTLIISKGPQKPQAVPVRNRFAPVAGYFFFPLMRYFDRSENTIDLLGTDSYLLGRLLYTLGIIMNSSANIPLISRMAGTLLDFIWAVGLSHVDQFVSDAQIFAFCMVVINTPKTILMNEFQCKLIDFQEWLSLIVLKDCDQAIGQKAIVALSLLKDKLKL